MTSARRNTQRMSPRCWWYNFKSKQRLKSAHPDAKTERSSNGTSWFLSPTSYIVHLQLTAASHALDDDDYSNPGLFVISSSCIRPFWTCSLSLVRQRCFAVIPDDWLRIIRTGIILPLRSMLFLYFSRIVVPRASFSSKYLFFPSNGLIQFEKVFFDIFISVSSGLWLEFWKYSRRTFVPETGAIFFKKESLQKHFLGKKKKEKK